MPIRLRTLFLVVSIVALAGAILWHDSSDETQQPDALQTGRDVAGRPVAGREVTPDARGPNGRAMAERQPFPNATSNGFPPAGYTATPPLPPTTEPLSSTYRDLVTRVRSGELPAACRLAVELERCSERRVTSWKQSLDNQTQALAKLPKDSAEGTAGERRLSYLRTRVEELTRHCADVVDTEGVPAWKYLFAAASNGHMPSMLRFAIRPPLGADTGTEA